MDTLHSKDGTRIAFDRIGQGPPLIIVVGAFNDRSTGAPLARFLAPHFTAFTYDRRGRGDSGDTAPYDVGREIEDLGALIAAAGGSAFVFGYSSGAVLALKAAAELPITRLALYDLPLGAPTASPDHAGRLSEMIATGRRGDAVEYFQGQVVGIPKEMVVKLRHAPFRPALEQMAPTLVYECLVMGDGSLPTSLASRITAPTLLLAGGAGAPFLVQTARSMADALPHGEVRILGGQSHEMVPPVLGPEVERFFYGQRELT
jgi:pimeloyl-ACP methyl ester carboxylesterase